MWAINIGRTIRLHVLPWTSPFFYKGSSDKLLLETNQVCVAMAGGWSVATAGRKIAEASVRVRMVKVDWSIHSLKKSNQWVIELLLCLVFISDTLDAFMSTDLWIVINCVAFALPESYKIHIKQNHTLRREILHNCILSTLWDRLVKTSLGTKRDCALVNKQGFGFGIWYGRT